MEPDSCSSDRPVVDPRPEPGALAAAEPPPVIERLRDRTPARVLIGRAGASYRTQTWLELRRDHAAARDAVCAGLDLNRDFGPEFIAEWGLFEVRTRARSIPEFLSRPDLGRSLDDLARATISSRCPAGADLQIAIADGLSAAAVRVQVPALLPLIAAEAQARGWRLGQPFVIHHGRVGLLNDIGELLDPAVAVLLIGERPGLATALSLSAYMSYRPRAGDDDSRRNLISNIHARGIPPGQAASRIARLADDMIRLATSGIAIKEQPTAAPTLPEAHTPAELPG